MQTSTNIVLIVVIGFLVLLQVASLAIITYLAKRIIEDKPIAIKETVAPGTPPTVVTRADLKVAREYQEEKNFKDKAQNNFADLEDLPAEEGMRLIEQMGNRGEE